KNPVHISCHRGATMEVIQNQGTILQSNHRAGGFCPKIIQVCSESGHPVIGQRPGQGLSAMAWRIVTRSVVSNLAIFVPTRGSEHGCGYWLRVVRDTLEALW